MAAKSKPNERGQSASDSQFRAFKQTARELGCDESEASFDKSLGKIGRAKVEPVPKKKPRKPLKITLPDA